MARVAPRPLKRSAKAVLLTLKLNLDRVWLNLITSSLHMLTLNNAMSYSISSTISKSLLQTKNKNGPKIEPRGTYTTR